MAAILKAPASLLAPPGPIATLSETPKRFAFSFKQKKRYPNPLSITSACSSTAFFRFPNKASWFSTLSPFAASGEVTETDEIEETETQEKQDNEVNGEAMENGGVDEEETVDSGIKALLESYKEALASADKSKLVEIEALFISIEDEKNALAKKIAILSEELSSDRDRILRISADFDNFRKRTERERLSLVENVQGEVIEKLLPILDNFERAKSQIKVETEGEEKINTSYQSIYKQFLEILVSLGVMVVETIGNPFDPLLHEAIMREDSSEFEEGIIIQEFRKGFKLGDRLLRPSMVKVSAGPGPAKPEGSSPAITEESGETSKESIGEDEESV